MIRAAFSGEVLASFLSKVCVSCVLVHALDGRHVAHDVGLDAAGVHRRHLDRMLGDFHLLPQCLGEPAHRELRRVVGGVPGHRKQPEHAGDVDDVAITGFDEVGEEHLGAVDDAPEVDVHHLFDVLELADLDVTGERDARVVVDLVDLAEVLL